jgi:hypothetical protein
MKKLVTALSAIALVMLSSSSLASNPYLVQTRCNLTEATAPNVRGLRLGMDIQQFLALFPGITKKKEMKDTIEKAKSATGDEVVTLGFDPVIDGEARSFAGIESVAATVYKGRVMDLNAQYGGATWRTVDEWVAKLSESFNLPRAQDWVVGPNESPNKVLNCDGIQIEAAIQGGSASIRVRNSGYLRESEERGRAAEDKKRKDVKP